MLSYQCYSYTAFMQYCQLNMATSVVPILLSHEQYRLLYS